MGHERPAVESRSLIPVTGRARVCYLRTPRQKQWEPGLIPRYQGADTNRVGDGILAACPVRIICSDTDISALGPLDRDIGQIADIPRLRFRAIRQKRTFAIRFALTK